MDRVWVSNLWLIVPMSSFRSPSLLQNQQMGLVKVPVTPIQHLLLNSLEKPMFLDFWCVVVISHMRWNEFGFLLYASHMLAMIT